LLHDVVMIDLAMIAHSKNVSTAHRGTEAEQSSRCKPPVNPASTPLNVPAILAGPRKVHYSNYGPPQFLSSAEATMQSTVVVPNFNHGRFLPHALRALLSQTRPMDELIIIDDASTDDSVAIIESFLSKHRHAVFLRNEKNLGAVRCMNIGLRMAHGSSVAFAAADDVVYPLFLERAVELLRAFPQAAFASGRTDIIDAGGNRICAFPNSLPIDRSGYIGPQAAAQHLMSDDAWFTGNVTLFNRSSLLALGGFPEELGALTDGFLSRVLVLKHGACFSPEFLGAWRRMEGGMAWSHSTSWVEAKRLVDSTIERMRQMSDVFPSGYPERWRGRHLFGVLRFGLVQARRSAKTKGAWHYVLAVLREAILTAWYFGLMRPQDVVAVLRRVRRHLFAHAKVQSAAVAVSRFRI
jgi:glycosyltransferase involved in cell wall biosynthesis